MRNFIIVCIFLNVLCAAQCSASVKRDLKKAIEVSGTDPQKAMRIYEEILREDPDDPSIPEIRYRLGVLYQDWNDSDRAGELFEELIKESGQTRWARGARIEVAGKSILKDAQAALTELSQWSAASDDSELCDRYHFYLGDCFYYLEKWEKSLEAYLKVSEIKLNKKHAAHLAYRIGLIYSRLQSYDLAEQFLTKSITINPAESDILIDLARICMNQSRIKDAMTYLTRAVSSGPGPLQRNRVRELISQKMSDQDLLASMDTRDPLLKFLLEMEYIRRLMSVGEFELAEFRITDLESQFPEHSSEINSLKMNIDLSGSICTRCLGLLVPLTGEMSAMGQSVYRGAQLAVDMLNAGDSDNRFTLSVKDTREESQLCETYFKELCEKDKVIGIIGPIRSNTSSVIAPLATDYGIPVISPGCPNATAIEASDYMFRLFPDPSRQAAIAVKFVGEVLGLKKIACLLPDAEYGHQAFQGLQSAALFYGMEIVYYSTYPKSKTAFHDIIPSLKASDPEVVFVLDSGQTAGILASQIRYHEMFRTILFGLSAWNDEFLIQIGGGSLEGSFFVSEYPDHSPARIRISSEFKNKFGEYPDAFALRAFEAVYLFSNGVITGGATTRYHLHRYLKQSKELPGLDGPAFFSDTKTYQPEPVIYRIEKKQFSIYAMLKNNQFRVIQSSDPTPTPETIYPTPD